MAAGQRVGSWLAVLQQAIVEDTATVHFSESQFEDEIENAGPLICSSLPMTDRSEFVQTGPNGSSVDLRLLENSRP